MVRRFRAHFIATAPCPNRVLPIPAVERARRDRGKVDAVEAAHVHVDLVRVGARYVERMDPAGGAEGMLRRAGVERVGRQRFGAADKLELFRRHDQVQKALLGADRAIAVGDARQIRRHLEAHAAAMTAAGHRRRHEFGSRDRAAGHSMSRRLSASYFFNARLSPRPAICRPAAAAPPRWARQGKSARSATCSSRTAGRRRRIRRSPSS